MDLEESTDLRRALLTAFIANGAASLALVSTKLVYLYELPAFISLKKTLNFLKGVISSL